MKIKYGELKKLLELKLGVANTAYSEPVTGKLPDYSDDDEEEVEVGEEKEKNKTESLSIKKLRRLVKEELLTSRALQEFKAIAKK